MHKKWDKITCDYVDDEDICYIDATEGVKQGKTIAWVDMLSGRVIYGCPEAMTDIQAQEAIKRTVEKAKLEHPYLLERLERLIRDIISFECEDTGTGVDVHMYLSSMGLSDEEMIFFGFPPHLV